jgi:hypothetical protein
VQLQAAGQGWIDGLELRQGQAPLPVLQLA